MGRKKKYESGTTVISFSIENEVLESIDENSNKMRLNRSEFITEILKNFVHNDLAYAKMMAKKHNREFY